MKLITLLTASICAISTLGAHAAENWKQSGFDMPESALIDTARDRIILSTIIGNPGVADGKGSLALLRMDGTVLDAEWVKNLNAPKGMAIVGDVLLVADLTKLHEIDLETGKLRRSLSHQDAVFLNDVTSDGENAYISDLMTNSIWRYNDGQLSLWMKSAQLSHPNGVLIDGDRLLIGSWGQGLHDDFTTEIAGSLLSVSLNNQEIRVIAPEIGNLDGITRIGNTVLVSDWVTGSLYSVTDDGKLTKTTDYAPGLADISSDGNTLYLPMMLDGTIVSVTYP